jgi:hypothetical protein
MNIRMPAPGCLFLRLIPFNVRLEADYPTGRCELGGFSKCLLSGPEVNQVERLLTVRGRGEYELVGLRPIVIDRVS